MIVVCLYVVAHRDIGYDVSKEEWICEKCAREARLVKLSKHAWFYCDHKHVDPYKRADYFYKTLHRERCCVCIKTQVCGPLIQTWTLEVKSNA